MVQARKVLNPSVLEVPVQPQKKYFVTFGKVVIKNTLWLFEDALTPKNARTVKRLGLRELDRTLDDTEDRSLVDRVTDDDINYERPYAYGSRRSLLDYLLHQR